MRAIHMMNIRSFDLNLLVGFEAMLVEGTVTKAAARVGLSQPAMSNVLARLRRALNDPLFIRSGPRMLPTGRARELAGPVADALAALREVLEPQPAFRPAGERRCYTIATTDYGECVALPKMLSLLARFAPESSIRVQRVRQIFDLPEHELEHCDFALSFFPQPLPVASGVSGAVLFEDEFIGVLRKKR